ncbi:MAG: hypothetical protein EZS28_044164, partial [Streblomastix strix]
MTTATKYVGIIFEFKIQSHHASNDCSQIYSAIDQIEDRVYCDCYPYLMYYVCVSVIISPREVAVGFAQGQKDYFGVNLERNVLTAVSNHNMDLQLNSRKKSATYQNSILNIIYLLRKNYLNLYPN